jgi:hypothetical protein
MTTDAIETHAEGVAQEKPSTSELALKMRRRCEGLAYLIETASENCSFPSMHEGMGIAQLFADISAAATELHETIRRENIIASGHLHDPIFLAIDRHKMLHRRFEDICSRTDEAAAEREGRVVTDDDRSEWTFADRIEQDALQALVKTKPETAAGVKAAVEYLSQVESGGESRLLAKFAMTLAGCELLEAAQ